MANIVLTPRCMVELTRLHPTLLEVLGDALAAWPKPLMTVTCIWRTAEEEAAAGGKTGIHIAGPPYRAVDVRVRDLDGEDGYSPADQVLADTVAAAVNEKWVYDEARPQLSVAFSFPHGSGPHIHFQCSNASRKRDGVRSA